MLHFIQFHQQHNNSKKEKQQEVANSDFKGLIIKESLFNERVDLFKLSLRIHIYKTTYIYINNKILSSHLYYITRLKQDGNKMRKKKFLTDLNDLII